MVTAPKVDSDPLMSIQALADRWGMQVATLYTWRTYGKGPKGFKLGKFVRYRLSEVEAYETAQMAKESA
ncbi:helix-turn-helix domain-containing protein [Cellulosimicrobium funkei]|nr:helix-turn-helix domain-containing protein [Cellulosimicrobium funkei]